jgi:O-antigen ligase
VLHWYLQFGYRFPALGEMRSEFILGTFLTTLAAFSWLASPGGAKTNLSVWTALFFLCFLVQLPFSYDPETSWDVFVDRVIKFSMMALFIVAFVRSPRRLWWFLAFFMLACMKMGQEGLLGTITGSLVWENQGVPRLHGPTPNYGHPNSFSGNALGTLPFVFLFLPIVRRPLKIALIIQAIFAFNIIIFTGSRTGYVAFAVSVLFLILMARSKKKAILCALLLGAVLTPLIPEDYFGRFNTIFTGHDKEGASIEARREILRDAWAIFLEHPLGVGVAAFPAIRKARFGRVQDTHNLYFEVATNLGVQGLMVFLVLIGAVLRTLMKLRRDVDSQLQRILEIQSRNTSAGKDYAGLAEHLADLKVLRATCIAVFVYLVIRLALGFFGMDLYEIYWWFALGLTLAVSNINVITSERTKAFIAQGEPGFETAARSARSLAVLP